MNLPSPGKTAVGNVPLAAFFAGALAVAVAVTWNAHAHYEGGWESFTRAGILLLIMLAALPYALAFGIGALVQYLRYQKTPAVSCRPALLAMLLHGAGAAVLIAVFLSI